jgi:hypothetical protein
MCISVYTFSSQMWRRMICASSGCIPSMAQRKPIFLFREQPTWRSCVNYGPARKRPGPSACSGRRSAPALPRRASSSPMLRRSVKHCLRRYIRLDHDRRRIPHNPPRRAGPAFARSASRLTTNRSSSCSVGMLGTRACAQRVLCAMLPDSQGKKETPCISTHGV